VLLVAVGASITPVMQVTLETCTQRCWHKLKVGKEPTWEGCIIPLGIAGLECTEVFAKTNHLLGEIFKIESDRKEQRCVMLELMQKEI